MPMVSLSSDRVSDYGPRDNTKTFAYPSTKGWLVSEFLPTIIAYERMDMLTGCCGTPSGTNELRIQHRHDAASAHQSEANDDVFCDGVAYRHQSDVTATVEHFEDDGPGPWADSLAPYLGHYYQDDDDAKRARRQSQ